MTNAVELVGAGAEQLAGITEGVAVLVWGVALIAGLLVARLVMAGAWGDV